MGDLFEFDGEIELGENSACFGMRFGQNRVLDCEALGYDMQYGVLRV